MRCHLMSWEHICHAASCSHASCRCHLTREWNVLWALLPWGMKRCSWSSSAKRMRQHDHYSTWYVWKTFGMKLKFHEMELDGLIRYAVLRRDQIQDRESKLSFIFLGFANPVCTGGKRMLLACFFIMLHINQIFSGFGTCHIMSSIKNLHEGKLRTKLSWGGLRKRNPRPRKRAEELAEE